MNKFIYDLDQFDNFKLSTKNTYLSYIDISILPRYNVIDVSVFIENYGHLGELIDMTNFGGRYLKDIVELLELAKSDDPVSINSIKMIPIRVVLDKDGAMVGIGNFIKDKFLIIDRYIKYLNGIK